MRREAEGGRWSGSGIGGELPASWSWGVASGGETWGVASKTQTSCPLALENSGGDTWALLFLKRPGGDTWALLFLKTTPISDETEGVLQQLIKIQLTTTLVKFS